MLLSAKRVGPTGKAYGLDKDRVIAAALARIDGQNMSAFIRATKPAAANARVETVL